MAKGWRSYATKELGKHIWSGDQIFLAASAKAHTKTQHRMYEIEAGAFGLQRGGWLEAAVDSAPNPMATPDAAAVARFIVQLASNPTYCSYLNKPVTLLQREDIIALFEGVDTTVGNTGSNATDQYSQRVRHFLSRPTEPLATGDLIRDVRYYTSLKTFVPRARDTLSDRPHPNLRVSQLAKPASAIEFDDLEDLRTRQVAHFEGRNRVLVELCATVLDSHDFVVESIRAARKIAINDLGLPPFICAQIVDKKRIPHYAIPMIQGEALLPVCVYLMDANKLFKKPHCIRLPTKKIEAFNPLFVNADRKLSQRGCGHDRQYWATEADFAELREHFWKTGDGDTAPRNDLLMRVIDATGFRRASANSLTTDMFSDAAIEKAVNEGLTHISVVPPEQKFGYNRAFPVSLNLAIAINRYINTERRQLLAKAGYSDADKSIHQRRIFLSTSSATGGWPLTHATVSKIFGRAFRAIGRKAGAATHSFRRKFAEQRWAEEIEFRMREGLSLAYEDIAMAVADDLGHESIVSQDAYHRVLSRIRKLSVEQQLRNQAAELNDEVAQPRSENAAVRALLSQLISGKSNARNAYDRRLIEQATELIRETANA